jgi:hypothetical protein
MTALAIEILDSRSFERGQNPRVTLHFKVLDCPCTDFETAHDAINAAAATTYASVTFGVLFKQQVSAEPVGPDMWEGEVVYGPGSMGQGETGSCEWSFEVGGGGRVHLSTSLETVGQYAAGAATPPDFKRAINVVRDGTGLVAKGIEVESPKLSWTETHALAYATVNTLAYIGVLYNLSGKTNDDTWRNFAKGQVRFMGASGQARGQRNVPVTFKFEVGPNLEDQSVGDITGINYRAHEYVWAFHDYDKDDDAKQLIVMPKAVYVERIHEYGDFTALGITQPWD